MKIVVNKCHGSFHVPADFADSHNVGMYDGYNRTDKELVQFVEDNTVNGSFIEGYAKLIAVEVPDTTTDWDLTDFDGWETVIYVVNGKLYYA